MYREHEYHIHIYTYTYTQSEARHIPNKKTPRRSPGEIMTCGAEQIGNRRLQEATTHCTLKFQVFYFPSLRSESLPENKYLFFFSVAPQAFHLRDNLSSKASGAGNASKAGKASKASKASEASRASKASKTSKSSRSSKASKQAKQSKQGKQINQ